MRKAYKKKNPSTKAGFVCYNNAPPHSDPKSAKLFNEIKCENAFFHLDCEFKFKIIKSRTPHSDQKWKRKTIKIGGKICLSFALTDNKQTINFPVNPKQTINQSPSPSSYKMKLIF